MHFWQRCQTFMIERRKIGFRIDDVQRHCLPCFPKNRPLKLAQDLEHDFFRRKKKKIETANN